MALARTTQQTIEQCDKIIAEWWEKLADDPTADADRCRAEIDRWLDARLALMKKEAA